MKTSTKKIGKTEISRIYEGIEKAGLAGFRIVSLHLAPGPRSVGAAGVDPNNPCHAVELPNGHYIIACD